MVEETHKIQKSCVWCLAALIAAIPVIVIIWLVLS